MIKYMAGLNMGFSWKGFDVSMQWTAAWNVSRSISSLPQPFTDRTNSDQAGLLHMLDHTWTPENPNPNAEYPRATFINDTNNYAESTLWRRCKHLCLKNLQIAYNFNTFRL